MAQDPRNGYLYSVTEDTAATKAGGWALVWFMRMYDNVWTNSSYQYANPPQMWDANQYETPRMTFDNNGNLYVMSVLNTLYRLAVSTTGALVQYYSACTIVINHGPLISTTA